MAGKIEGGVGGYAPFKMKASSHSNSPVEKNLLTIALVLGRKWILTCQQLSLEQF